MSNNAAVKSSAFIEIKSSSPLFDLRIGELLHYRYLIFLFVKRDFITNYKQTILGPLWHVLQPLLTTLIYAVIFGRVAKIPHDGIPTIVFYLSGMTLWNYFAACFNKTSTTFLSNAAIFGKVYFPRITVPLATAISNLMSLLIQMLLLIFFLIIYRNYVVLHYTLLLTPVLILLLAFMGLGFGIIVSSLTIRYRDLAYLMNFGIQLWMFATPIIYPLSLLQGKLRTIAKLNPVTPIIEGFRYSLFGKGEFMWHDLLYTTVFTIIIVLIGIVLFNRTERDFMDTV